MDQVCPKCGLISPPSATHCDCGWNFAMRQQVGRYAGPNRVVVAGLGGAVIGALVFAGLAFLDTYFTPAAIPMHGGVEFLYLFRMAAVAVPGFLLGGIASTAAYLIRRSRRN
jgi:hypothetical protein